MKWLFLHGASGSKDKWRMLRPHLADFQADFIDLPGHGENSDPLPESVEKYADILEHLIDEDTAIVGHSMGGLIGLALAARNSRVKGLVMAASHYRLPVHPDFIQSLKQDVYPEKFFYASYGKETDPELLAEEKKAHDETALQTALADFTCCNAYNGKQALEQLDISVLAVYGEEDRMIPKDSKEKFKSVYPSVAVETIEGAGHYVILEKPEAFVDALRRFRERLEGE